MKLLIVESPTKAKTIESYLNNEYKVVSTKGAIRELKTTGVGGFGIDLKNQYKPAYEIMDTKKKEIDELKKLAKNSDEILIATDPDREGEAIAWHVLEVLGLNINDHNRVTFNEITKHKINEEIKNKRTIDLNLVHSQEARRVIDRVIGFSLSQLVQNKIGSRSAGRVQSVALKLVVDLEKEIKAFIPTKYYLVQLIKNNPNFKKEEQVLFKGEYLNIKPFDITKDDLAKITKEAVNPYTVISKEIKESSSRLKSPFTTSLIQQEAFNKFGYSARRTMNNLQSLFEGISINNELVGLITYIRTDSKRLAPEFIDSAKAYIKNNFGDDYIGSTIKNNDNKNIQDAHEAIRPTSLNIKPDDIKHYLSTEEYKLYKLIFERTLASIMSPAKISTTQYILDSNGHQFKIEGKELLFKGNLIFDEREDNILPDYQIGDKITDCILSTEEKETLPPARYTEASLIKTLEDKGIGRPSTYATIMQALKNRDYVNTENKHFVPTVIGIVTSDKLQEYFANIINDQYTSNMETGLDLIAEDKETYFNYIDNFYNEYMAIYVDAKNRMPKVVISVDDKVCPNCGGKLIYRNSRFGRFIGCSNYPNCTYIEKINKPKYRKFYKKPEAKE